MSPGRVFERNGSATAQTKSSKHCFRDSRPAGTLRRWSSCVPMITSSWASVAPALGTVDGEALGGQIFNVFTLSNGRITRIEDHRLRADALGSVGMDDPGW